MNLDILFEDNKLYVEIIKNLHYDAELLLSCLYTDLSFNYFYFSLITTYHINSTIIKNKIKIVS